MWLIVMNGRQRNATTAQIWGKYYDSNYDGNCTARHCLSGTYEISRRWIFVRQSVQGLYYLQIVIFSVLSNLNMDFLNFAGIVVWSFFSYWNVWFYFKNIFTSKTPLRLLQLWNDTSSDSKTFYLVHAILYSDLHECIGLYW